MEDKMFINSDYPIFYIGDLKIYLFDPEIVLNQIKNKAFTITEVINKYNEVHRRFENNKNTVNNKLFRVFKKKYSLFVDMIKEYSLKEGHW